MISLDGCWPTSGRLASEMMTRTKLQSGGVGVSRVGLGVCQLGAPGVRGSRSRLFRARHAKTLCQLPGATPVVRVRAVSTALSFGKTLPLEAKALTASAYCFSEMSNAN